MARATDDVRQLNFMVSPGFRFIYESVIGIIVPLVYIGMIRLELLLIPVLFVLVFLVLLRDYTRRLEPVMEAQRETYGKLNAGLEETISGIEVVKASVQEAFERMRFRRTSHLYRDSSSNRARSRPLTCPCSCSGSRWGARSCTAWSCTRTARSPSQTSSP